MIDYPKLIDDIVKFWGFEARHSSSYKWYKKFGMFRFQIEIVKEGIEFWGQAITDNKMIFQMKTLYAVNRAPFIDEKFLNFWLRDCHLEFVDKFIRHDLFHEEIEPL